MLASFDEPTWNNPVVRIIDPDRTLIVPRINGDWTLGTLAHQLAEALKKRQKPVPEYLKLLAQEEVAQKRGVETAIFGMT